MSYVEALFNEFNVMVSAKSGTINTKYIELGYVLDFIPTADQVHTLRANARNLNVNTMFTAEERLNGNIIVLLAKQAMHYFEVYGLHRPGLFNLEVDNGKTLSLRFVKGATGAEVQKLVNDVVYANAPVRNADSYVQILNKYDNYEFEKIRNNELRIALFDPMIDTFTSGDDVLRWMIRTATDSNLLIKSPDVVEALKSKSRDFHTSLLERHTLPLAQVFNRHKALILALKNSRNRTVINKISRLSKKKHVPIRESISKTFISKALNGAIADYSVLDKISVRDKFKYLNLLEWKTAQSRMDAFVIRNGKVHVEKDRPVYDIAQIEQVTAKVLESLGRDLVHLNEKNIVLDPRVDIGLPISRKQTMGNLPFGTTVTVDSEEISAGVHWTNDYNVYDLDLSAIDDKGNRYGWGNYNGYADKDIVYSGDVTSAHNGAMEFLTSMDQKYGAFVNVYNGSDKGQADIVVGNKATKTRWIDSVILQERIDLPSRGMIIGFVNNNKFIVYTGRLNNSKISVSHPIVERGFADFWTVSRLLNALNISFDYFKKDVDYDFDLTYSGFTFEKVEAIFN